MAPRAFATVTAKAEVMKGSFALIHGSARSSSRIAFSFWHCGNCRPTTMVHIENRGWLVIGKTLKKTSTLISVATQFPPPQFSAKFLPKSGQ
jgi:hypothetical protein